MFNLDKFIADSVTLRPVNMFVADIYSRDERINGTYPLALSLRFCYIEIKR